MRRSTVFSSEFSLPSSINLPTTSPIPKSEISFIARRLAKSAISSGSPFSKRVDASLRRPSFLEVSLTLVLLKLAASKTIFVVSSVTSVSKPPITPAMPTAFAPSAIISISESSFLSSPSRVFKTSPSLASRTISFLSANLSKS